MRLSRRSLRALTTRGHDIDEVRYSEAKGVKYASEVRGKSLLRTFNAMLTNARQNRQVSACLQTNCCRLVYTQIAVGRVSADPLRKLDCLPKFGSAKTPNQRSKVRCWQSNPLSKVHESKIGYTVKLQYEGRRKRCRRKNLCENLTVSPKYGSTIKSKFKVENVLSAKYIP